MEIAKELLDTSLRPNIYVLLYVNATRTSTSILKIDAPTMHTHPPPLHDLNEWMREEGVLTAHIPCIVESIINRLQACCILKIGSRKK